LVCLPCLCGAFQGFTDLGDFFYQRGELDQALKQYVRSRDYCHITRHNIEMCLNVIKVGSTARMRHTQSLGSAHKRCAYLSAEEEKSSEPEPNLGFAPTSSEPPTPPGLGTSPSGLADAGLSACTP
jgi:hypothetical protein